MGLWLDLSDHGDPIAHAPWYPVNTTYLLLGQLLNGFICQDGVGHVPAILLDHIVSMSLPTEK